MTEPTGTGSAVSGNGERSYTLQDIDMEGPVEKPAVVNPEYVDAAAKDIQGSVPKIPDIPVQPPEISVQPPEIPVQPPEIPVQPPEIPVQDASLIERLKKLELAPESVVVGEIKKNPTTTTPLHADGIGSKPGTGETPTEDKPKPTTENNNPNPTTPKQNNDTVSDANAGGLDVKHLTEEERARQQAQQQRSQGGGGGGGGGIGAAIGGMLMGVGRLGGSAVRGVTSRVTEEGRIELQLRKDITRVDSDRRKAVLQNHIALPQIHSAKEYFERYEKAHGKVITAVEGMNTTIDTLPQGQVFNRAMQQAVDAERKLSNVTPTKARENVWAKIHDFDCREPDVMNLRVKADALAEHPEVKPFMADASRAMYDMNQAGKLGLSSMQNGLKNLPDGPAKLDAAQGFRDMHERISATPVPDAALSKPGEGDMAKRLEQLQKTMNEMMQNLMEKIQEAIERVLGSIFGRK